MGKSRYTTIPDTDVAVLRIYPHATDVVQIDGERLQCCPCGQAFTLAKAGYSPTIGFRGPGLDSALVGLLPAGIEAETGVGTFRDKVEPANGTRFAGGRRRAPIV
jgi:hypothetical protein